MARGRMINTTICADKRINDLSDDTSRLAFTWLIPFADKNGRTHGDPAMLCSMLFPRRRDVTPEQMERYIREWAELGLITWYQADDDLWIEFPAFGRNQPGLRKDREPDSNIPAPEDGVMLSGSLPDNCRNDDGEVPEDSRNNARLREENRKEDNENVSSSSCGGGLPEYVQQSVRAYENAIGFVSDPGQSAAIRDTLEELHTHGIEEWWQAAIGIAVDNNRRSWGYIRGILENCLREGTAPQRKNGPARASPRGQKRKISYTDPITGDCVEKEVTA